MRFFAAGGGGRGQREYNQKDEQGRKQGHWIVEDEHSNVFEGSYVDSKKHGHWILRTANGGVEEGLFVDGEKHGRWVHRFADGTVQHVTFCNGEVIEVINLE